MNREDVAALCGAIKETRPCNTKTTKQRNAMDYVQAYVAWEATVRGVMRAAKARHPRLFAERNFLQACGVQQS